MKTLVANLVIAPLAAFLLTAGLQAQQSTPSPEQAPLLIRMLDQDGDKKVSRDEAMGDLRYNFAFVDSNGDGGIDLDELTRVLNLAAGQRASRNGGGTAGATLANSAGPSFGARNDKQLARMQSLSPDEDREFLMVNVIKYRPKAEYADGRETDLTGEQADALYAPVEFIAQIGGEVAFVGRVNDQIGKSEPRWDRVAIVRYPSRAKFFEMVTNLEFQKRAIHKDAGVEVSYVLLTERVPWTLSGAKRVADKDDAFTLVQLLKYRETAKYTDGNAVEPKRTGKEAMDAFDVATDDFLMEVGANRVLRTTVEGALIGDGRTWDEFRMLHFPSQAAYSDAVQKMQDAMKHRDAAIDDSYLMKVKTMRQQITQQD